MAECVDFHAHNSNFFLLFAIESADDDGAGPWLDKW